MIVGAHQVGVATEYLHFRKISYAVRRKVRLLQHAQMKTHRVSLDGRFLCLSLWAAGQELLFTVLVSVSYSVSGTRCAKVSVSARLGVKVSPVARHLYDPSL